MSIEYLVFSIVFVLGLYCAVAKDNLIKKIIGLSIMTRAIHLLLISFGYRTGGVIPIITSIKALAQFNSFSVDPLPQALVLTSIVIDLSITALALTLAIKAYRRYNTLDMSKITEVRE